MVDSKHQWKAWIYLLPAIILLLIFTVWPIINTVVTAFIYDVEFNLAAIQVEETEDGCRFYRADEKGNKYYINASKNDKGAIELQYSSKADSLFVYNEELGVWTTAVGEKTYFLGADKESDLNVIELTEDVANKIGNSIYPAGIFADVPNNLITKDFVSKTGYKMGVFKGLPEAYVYVNNVTSDGYINVTNILDDAAKIWPETVKVDGVRGYKLYVEDAELVKHYLTVVASDDGKLELQYADTTENIFIYNKESKAWTCTIEDAVYYLALDSETNHLGLFTLADVAQEGMPSPVTFYMHRGTASEAKEVSSLIQDNAYRIGAHRNANGTQTYLSDSASENAGLRLTTSVSGDAVSKVGMHNFVKVLTDEGSDFMVCLKNTLILTVITVPISTILALLIAVALNSIKPLQKLLQTIFFLPYVTNSIAIGMVFAAMFNIVGLNSANESVGIINNILGVFGIERVNWINQGAPAWASFTALIIYIVWNALPFKILILLGGLQSINKQYYDAAKVDGTPKWRVLLRITVPLLSPMLTYTVITSFIGGFKEYSSVVGIFGDGRAVPGGANMNTIVGHIQDHLTITRDYGLAGAAALMLFAIIFVVTMINLWVSKKNTHY
ncbi:MAG: sugar ABC transporter permease [Ruminococcaceae bacterium]|nr:sugar ABC transporter permease [Oscillospiraceae bacterium]